MLTHTPDIMEVTLRDGSYVIDFQFTAADTATLVSALESAGFRWIEVGHGLGLNAQDKGQRHAVESDEAHLQAAAQAIKAAKWGMFFIPGVGRAEDIDLAAHYEMSFIRIGTNVTEMERARPFIEQAKKHGMFTCYNAMKSYAVSPEDFAKVAKQAQDSGADMVYIVDSAGTMMPEDVSTFCQAIQAETDIPIGFHGHDNLSLGMANTLAAIESGAAIVDSSLRGMGRSAGNVITEALLAILQRRGLLHDIDLKATMDISAGVIAPLVPGRGLDTMAITAGYAGFHSSFTQKVKQYAENYAIDMRDLIVRLCEQDQVNAPDDLLAQLSADIARENQPRQVTVAAFKAREDAEPDHLTLPKLLKRLYADAQKFRTQTVLNIVLSQVAQEQLAISSHVHTSPTHTIGSVTISTEMHLVEVLGQIDGEVDMILLDTDRRRIFGPQMTAATAQDILKKTRLLVYSDSRAWVEAVKDQVVRLLDEQVAGAPVVIAGDHPRSRLLALMLMDYGADVTVIVRTRDEDQPYTQATTIFSQTDYPLHHFVDEAHAANYLEAAKVVVVWPSWGTWLTQTMVDQLANETYVIDAGIGSLADVAYLRDSGQIPVRVNMWPTLSGIIMAADLGATIKPKSTLLGDFSIAAGGFLAHEGTFIVDDVDNPARVIGVADGNGGLLADTTEYAEKIAALRATIQNRQLQPRL